MGTVHVFFAPRQAPDQARSFQPLAGAATSLTDVYEANAAEQRGRHVIPARELRMVPCPVTATVSR
jgi:hypothetical protein